jgi:hypothetical protein
VLACPTIPTNLGAGTNEDRVIALPAPEAILYASQPTIDVFPEVGSSPLTVRVQAHLYAAFIAGRKPAAIGVLSGTELTTPSFA